VTGNVSCPAATELDAGGEGELKLGRLRERSEKMERKKGVDLSLNVFMSVLVTQSQNQQNYSNFSPS